MTTAEIIAQMQADTARWIEGYPSALAAGPAAVAAYLATDRARSDALFQEAFQEEIYEAGCRAAHPAHRPNGTPASAAEQARAAEGMAELTGILRRWSSLTRAQRERLGALDTPGLPSLLETRRRVLEQAAAARPPLAGGDETAVTWLGFSGEAAHFGFELLKLGEATEAQTVFEHLHALDPTNYHRTIELAECHLRRGNYAAAWPLTRTVGRQARWRQDRYRFGNGEPWKPGEELRGRTLLIAAGVGGGLGDMIWHYRYVPLIASRLGARVVVEAQPTLARLLRSSFKATAEVCDLPQPIAPPAVPYDAWCPHAAPAGVFANDPKALPNKPYLAVDPALVARWRKIIGPPSAGRLRIALNWSADPSIPGDQRSLALAALAPLAKVPGIELFSLQKTATIRPSWQYPVVNDPEAEPAPKGMKLTRLGPLFEDLADCAAAMMCLDLVVTCDTSIAHLAGALGRPTWTLLPAWPDALFELERETCPWYPTMRLFRPQRHGDWAPMVAQVRRELARLVRRR